MPVPQARILVIIVSTVLSFLGVLYAILQWLLQMVLNLIPSNRRKSRGRHENVSSATMLIGHMRGQSLASLAVWSSSLRKNSICISAPL